ncbi:MAG: hypothetical protein DDT26_00177 [Dehalococcoidia bacterium]|nr:hypothetical protein [Chloroflexota bacterium]
MKKCKVCSEPFDPIRPLQKVCSPACALTLARRQAEKTKAKALSQDRKATREKLQAMQTRPQLLKRAQTAFNTFIRARDSGKPCISCGTKLSDEPNTYDAGHYRSVGSAPHLRFIEHNVHGQCKNCNNYLAGNHVAYRMGLIGRIGLTEVEKLEADSEPRKYTRDDLIELAKTYRDKARKLLKPS